MTSSERTAPLGRLWATPGDLPHQHAISREFALDSGLPDPEQYPSWPNYPDERNLPVAHEARARWKLRLAKIQEKTDKKKTDTILAVDSGQRCVVCKKPLKAKTTKPSKFCSDACRKAASRA